MHSSGTGTWPVAALPLLRRRCASAVRHLAGEFSAARAHDAGAERGDDAAVVGICATLPTNPL